MSEEVNKELPGQNGQPKPEPLRDEVKNFIVELLACYESPGDVVKAVKEEFDLNLSKQRIEYYDPTKRAAANGLSKDLKQLFWRIRRKYDKESADNLKKLNHRLGLRAFMIRNTLAKGNYALVDALLVNAAKDEGGAFTNRRELTGKNGAPVQIEVDEARRRDLAKRMLAKLITDGKSEQEARAELIKLGVNEHDLSNS